MKQLARLALLLAATLLPAAAFAQTPPAGTIGNQETPQAPRAATLVADAQGIAQQTLTLTCPAGQFVYLLSYEEMEHATTAPVATFLTTTTTNLNGKKWYNFMPAAIGASSFKITYQPAQPLKASTNTATIVSNAAVTNVNFDMDANYFCAP